MRLIDADAFTNVLKKEKKYMRLLMSKETALIDVLSTVIDDLEGTGLDGYKNAPTVDAIEVIRCKDCVYYNVPNGMTDWCDVWGNIAREDDFCSYAERIEDETG